MSTAKLTLVTLASAAIGCLIFFSSTLEDALITFRYSVRLSEGYAFGMWNRVGEPVEGFTTFLWMPLIAIPGPRADAIASFAKILGYASYSAIVILFVALYHKASREDLESLSEVIGNQSHFAYASRMTAISLGLCLPLAWYAVSGMETVTFSLLLALSVFLPLLTAKIVALILTAVAITLIRPEGVLVAITTSVFWFWSTRERRHLWTLSAAVATFAFLIIFRLGYFGSFLPNTYYAKAGGTEDTNHVRAGIIYFIRAGYFYWMWTVPLVGFLLARAMRGMRLSLLHSFLLISQFSFMLVIAKAGGDNWHAFPLFRHLIVIFPLFFMTTLLFISPITKWRNHIFGSIIACMLIFTCGSWPIRGELLSFPSRIAAANLLKNEYNDAALIHWLADVTDEGTIVATSLAGAIPFLVDAIHIDILGLNDVKIAHEGSFDPYGPTDSKTKMSSVIDREPDIIEAYMKATDLLTGAPEDTIFSARAKMNMELLRDARFTDNYLMITNAPYESFNRILFVHRDWLSESANNSRIETAELDRVLAAFDATDHPKKALLYEAEN